MKTRLNWLEFVLLAAPFVVLMIYWNDLPDRIPMHWNYRGEIDGWAERRGIFLLPSLGVGLALLLRVLLWFDPKLRRNLGETGRMTEILPIIRLTLLGLFNTIFFAQIAASLGKEVASGRIIMTGLLLFLVILGNYLGTLRPNYFVGIRTPWTLENPDTWRATHRLGGRLMFFGGLFILMTQFFLNVHAFSLLSVGAILALAIWGFVYSWHHCRTHAATR